MTPNPGRSVLPRAMEILGMARRAYQGELPERYRNYPASFRAPFDLAVKQALATNQRILDVGAGRTPTVPPHERPPGSHYVALDASGFELKHAQAGSYDEVVVADITEEVSALKESFDVIVSFQALEHVKPIDRAFANMFLYLRPGGRLVAQLSGTFSVYALINRVTPQALNRRIQARLYHREPSSVFPAFYDRCCFAALKRLTQAWAHADIQPLWLAEPYFHFSPLLRSSYILYEEWARLSGWINLAPYYLIKASR